MEITLSNQTKINIEDNDTGISIKDNKGNYVFLTQTFLNELSEFRNTTDKLKRKVLLENFRHMLKTNTLF